MEETNCQVCGNRYLSSMMKRTPDSHDFYPECYPCPNCGYNPEINQCIHEALKNIELDAYFKDGELKVRFLSGKLEELIIDIIRKSWPDPSRKKMKGGDEK